MKYSRTATLKSYGNKQHVKTENMFRDYPTEIEVIDVEWKKNEANEDRKRSNR